MPNYSGTFTGNAHQESSFGLPIGSIIAFTPPTNLPTLPTGWILADGTPYLRTTYPLLFNTIGTANGDGTQTANGAASGFGAGTAFNVPDLRGFFMRGGSNYGPNGASGRDPDAATRVALRTGGAVAASPGAIQGDAMQRHFHYIGDVNAPTIHRYTRGFGTQSPPDPPNSAPTDGSSDPGAGGGSGRRIDRAIDVINYPGGPAIKIANSETRPLNYAVVYMVRAF